MVKTSSADDVSLGVRFDELRSRLLQSRYEDRLSRPLEFWVLPSDRRLPLALLGRSLRELLTMPFEEITATPGIGQKKINSLVKLLDRATHDEPPTVSVGGTASEERPGEPVDTTRFDPAIVSEALWTEWRETVRQFDVGDEPLGRLAPSLQRLPTVIWYTPLRQYLDHSLGEIRRLRTHGEKRVRCVLEVFHSVYQRLLEADTNSNLTELLMPPWIREAERWIEVQSERDRLPSHDEIRDGFARPLLGLISVDCGPTVLHLVEERLGLQGQPRSVRDQAKNLGVTRARVYQLLDDCGKVMTVRWPNGRAILERFTSHLSSLEGPHDSSLRLYFSLSELCFPDKQLELFVAEPESEPLASSSESSEASEAGLESPALTAPIYPDRPRDNPYAAGPTFRKEVEGLRGRPSPPRVPK